MLKPKILIVYKNPKIADPNACHVGMGVTSNNNKKFLVNKKIDAYCEAVIDGYHLQKLLMNEYKDVTHVIMNAPFFDSGFLKILCNQFPNIQFTIIFHSNSGFLGLDKWSMGMLGELIKCQQELKNFKVSVNSQKFAKVVNEIFFSKQKEDVLVLPNLYPINVKLKKPSNKKVVKVGCFSAIRTLKNIPTAAFAAAILGKLLETPVEFHIVVGRNEDSLAEKIITGIENLYKSIPNIKLVKNDWVEWEEFLELISEMDILFMPSFTESFNNVTADAITQCVPVVVGEAINWLPDEFKANSDDAYDIAGVGLKLLNNPFAIADALDALRDHNDCAFDHWKNYVLRQEKPQTIATKIKKFFKKIFS